MGEPAPETAGQRGASNPLNWFCAAVAEDLHLLASLHDVEPDAAYLEALRATGVQASLGISLESERGGQAIDVLSRALDALPRPLDQDSLNDLAADYANIYLTFGLKASPQESVWMDEEELVCQDSMFQVRSWYEHYGLSAPDWRKRADDHLVFQLHFIAHLLRQGEALESVREAARFMDEHLLRWLMSFAERVAARCATAYFAGASMLTAAYCEELRDLLADILQESRPTAAEIEKRMQSRRPAEEVPVEFAPGAGPAV